MRFETNLLPGTLIKRYKRFFADVELEDGRLVTAHCPNTGAMTGCADPGSRVYLSEHNNPNRKLKFTWEIVINSQGDWIGVNTHKANILVEEAILAGKIDTFAGYDSLKREVKYGQERSRIDLFLQGADQLDCYVEVKSVTLKQDGIGYFPDAVTERGQKHLRELVSIAQAGHRSVLFFCVQHTGINEVCVAEHIDPAYAQLCREARQQGVEVIAWRAAIDPENIYLNQSLPVNL
ncbi:DNA/RNA nuclease SfsA [Paraneptunicella aestuarii]|uniref:DNA/RNA nuclease SfsA n=1 Tax=Paraneptunicella aestuarii TaxID=2831148 RepID=UPI001E5F3BDC|nr:DNA/RNA nuclease SfsA [Paraneptunicella aestuarii]UAA38523.1 DNA/RNA nuclease SfsA [Paraneptunicella aestuarii]